MILESSKKRMKMRTRKERATRMLRTEQRRPKNGCVRIAMKAAPALIIRGL